MNNHKKSIAKLFGPVLLLTGALALPADIAAAPTAKSVVARPDKDQHREKRVKQQHNARAKREARANAAQHNRAVRQKQVRQKQARQQQVQQKQVQRQVRSQRQQRLESQRLKQAQLDRQVQLQRQAQRQQQLNVQRQRQAQLDRQVQLQRQAAARQRVIVGPRNRFVARPYAYRTSPYYRDGRYYVPAVPVQSRGGRDRSVIAADGYLDASRDCLILRGHEGQVYSLVGDNGGLQEGDHVRLLGRLTYDRHCGAQALDVTQVQAVWADRNHRQVYFDHQTDGSFNRYSDDRYYDDRYEDDYYEDYDRYEEPY